MPWLAIVLASAVAHLWCLGSVFYLDDYPQILENTNLRDGHILSNPVLAWTNLWMWIELRIFGPSPAAIHAVNWMLHTACACALYLLARDFPGMDGNQRVAWFAALLFAVHPLGSEIPNYARTQDLAWVTLFSLIAAWLVTRIARSASPWHWLALALAVLGAACSKGPGLFHALMACAAVAGVATPRARWPALRRHAGKWAVALACFAVVLVAMGWLGTISRAMGLWNEPRFAGHALTICRVFWEFAWRAVIPARLCADHHIAETLVPTGPAGWQAPDTIALLAAVGLVLWLVIAAALAWRGPSRLAGLGLLLFGLTIGFRILYLVPEFMPEYRIYPGLPWFCVALAILLAAAWRRFIRFSPLPAAIALLLGFATLSARRAMLWHDTDRLMTDVLAQYPTQSRAVWVMQNTAARAGRWQQVVTRHQQLLPTVDKALQQANKELAPARELPTGHHALAMIGCICLNARAMGHQHGPAIGLRMLAGLDASLKNLHPPPQQIHWDLVTHARGLLLEQAGDYNGAIRELTIETGVANARLLDLERVKEKLAARAPSP